MSEYYDYDAIIIGAGISGLVCGCYLAKAGLKTLIIEKNPKPGGYCTSFTRDNFHFDACVHALSSLRNGGLLQKLLKELGIIDKIKFIRKNPADLIFTPDLKISIFNEIDKTTQEFKDKFPRERIGIEKFFKYIYTSSFLEIRSKNFMQLLDFYFSDKKLKAIFSIVMFQLLGVKASELSAVVACLLWREFMFDGGYYPIGGMQVLPNALWKRFLELKGEILFSKEVEKIKVEANRVSGVTLNDDKYFSCRIVVSACDAMQTFSKFIDKGKISKSLLDKLSTMQVASSGFLVYIGANKILAENMNLNSNIYVITNYKLEEAYSNSSSYNFDHLVIACSSNKSKVFSNDRNVSVFLGANAAYKDYDYWNESNKNVLADRLLKMAEIVFPGLSRNIKSRIIATPATLERWTKNHLGSGYGWASTPERFGDPTVSQITEIENLYLTGHWSNQSSGVSFVANCGYNTADIILHKEKIK